MMRQSAPRRMRCDTSNDLGVSPKRRTTLFLTAKGYRTLGKRWKSPIGRIDLVVKRGQLVVSIEITAQDQETTAEAILPHQQRRIIAAPKAWLAAHPEHARYDMRIGAVPVAPRRMPQPVLSAVKADI